MRLTRLQVATYLFQPLSARANLLEPARDQCERPALQLAPTSGWQHVRVRTFAAEEVRQRGRTVRRLLIRRRGDRDMLMCTRGYAGVAQYPEPVLRVGACRQHRVSE